MTTYSPCAQRPAPGLPKAAAAAAPEPAVIGFDPGQQGDATVETVWERRDGKTVCLGLRHGRLGFGLGGGRI